MKTTLPLVDRQTVIDKTISILNEHLKKHIGLEAIRSLAMVGSYAQSGSYFSLDSDLDFCVFLRDQEAVATVKSKTSVDAIEAEINAAVLETPQDHQMVCRPEVKLWLHGPGPDASTDASTPVDHLELDGWSGLAPTYLELYMKMNGTTVHGERIIENLAVGPNSVPIWESYELLQVTKTEFALGLASDNAHKLTKSTLRALAALMLAHHGIAITRYDDLDLLVRDYLAGTEQGKRIMLQACRAHRSHEPFDVNRDELIHCFFEFEQIISWVYRSSLKDRPDAAMLQQRLFDYRMRTAPRIVQALSREDLWTTFKLFRLYDQEIDKFIFQVPPRYLSYATPETHDSKVRRKIQNAVHRVAKHALSALNLDTLVIDTEEKYYEVNALAWALSYNKSTIPKSIDLYQRLRASPLASPEIVRRILHDIAVDYDTLGDYEQSIATWKTLIDELIAAADAQPPDDGAADEVAHTRLMTFQAKHGLAVTYSKAGRSEEAFGELVSMILTLTPFQTEPGVAALRRYGLDNLFVTLESGNVDLRQGPATPLWERLSVILKEEVEDPSAPSICRLTLAEGLSRTGDLDGAKTVLTAASKAQIETDLRISTKLGEVWFALGEYSKSFECFLDAICVHQDAFERFYRVFRDRLGDPDVEEALPYPTQAEKIIGGEERFTQLVNFGNAVIRYAQENLMWSTKLSPKDIRTLRRLKGICPLNLAMPVVIQRAGGEEVHANDVLTAGCDDLVSYMHYVATVETEEEKNTKMKMTPQEESQNLISHAWSRCQYGIKMLSDIGNKTYEALKAMEKRDLKSAERHFCEALRLIDDEDYKRHYLSISSENDFIKYRNTIVGPLSDIYFDQMMFFTEKQNFNEAWDNAQKFFSLADGNARGHNNCMLVLNRFGFYREALKYAEPGLARADKDEEKMELSILIGDAFYGILTAAIQSGAKPDRLSLVQLIEGARSYYHQALVLDAGKLMPTEQRTVVNDVLGELNHLASTLQRWRVA